MLGTLCLAIAGAEMMLLNEQIKWMIYIVSVSKYLFI